MDPRLSRRSFLLGAAGAASTGLVACSKGSKVIHVGSQSQPSLNLLLTSGAADGPTEQALSTFEAGIPQRVAFVLAGQSGFLSPAPGTVQLQFGSDGRHWGPAQTVDVHADTGAQASTYSVVTHQFASPGTSWLRASYEGMTADSPVNVIDAKAAKIPLAGQKLISTPTPTDADHRAVSPICTRSPECPFHAVSLDDALAASKPLPIVLLFATPALCETATCGPVLDSLVAASAAHTGRITLIHSEIFVALSRSAPNTPAVRAYHLQSEPVLFLADGNGTVAARIDGLVGRAELTAALDRLVAA